MPRKKVEPLEKVKIDEVKPTKTDFIVVNSSGGEVRTYSHELHGENAEALAHQYAGKIGGSVISK